MHNKENEFKIGEVRAGNLVNEQMFYERFAADLKRAKMYIEILSPYVTTRHRNLLRLLLKRVKQQVKVVVYTRPPWQHDARMGEMSERVLKLFAKHGIKVREIEGMHQKIAIIDNNICWEGSLNILSHRESRESMRRLEGELIAAELRLVHDLPLPASL